MLSLPIALALLAVLQTAPPLIAPAPLVEARAGSLEFTQPRIRVEGSEAPYRGEFWVVVTNRGSNPDRLVSVTGAGPVDGPPMVYVRDRDEQLMPQTDPLSIPPNGPDAAVVVVRAFFTELGDEERHSNGVPVRLQFEQSGSVAVTARPPRPMSLRPRVTRPKG